MMTILPSANTPPVTEKRSYDSISTTNTSDALTPKRVKSTSPATATGSNNDFSSKMMVQLAKSVIAALDPLNPIQRAKYSESPIESLAQTLSLPLSNPQAINTPNLTILISHLTSEIARLDTSEAFPLLNAILKINWIQHAKISQAFSQSYTTFLIVLVSTIPKWWKEVAIKIISDFSKASETVLASHHETLKKLIALAPTSSTSLPKLLKSNFPNKNSSKHEILFYIRNILYVTEYYDVLVTYVWSLIFENFIKLDVELQNQIDEVDDDDLTEALGLDESDNEDDDDEGVEDDESESDDDDSDSDDDDLSDDEQSVKIGKVTTVEEEIIDSDNEDDTKKSKKSSNVIKKVTFSEENDKDEEDEFDDDMLDSEAEYTIELESLSELSSKLDLLLTYLLSYLKPKLSVQSLESGQGINIFSAVTSAFRSMNLPTHGTKATQYIIFYAAQQQPELIDAFLVSLFEIVFNSDKKSSSSTSLSNPLSSSNGSISNLNSRITGIQYIASFVARAEKLSDTQIISVVSFLVDYCTAYMEEHIDDEDDNENNNENNGRKNSNKSSTSRSNSNNNATEQRKKEFNPMKHSMFYSLVQALMYIVCFRKDAFREPEFPTNKPDSETENKTQNKGTRTGWAAALDKFFTRVIVSKYDPLRWCNETVVLIFSRVAQTEGICYTWSVVERIRRERVGRVNDGKSTSKEDLNIPKDSTSLSNTGVSTQSSIRATQEFLDLVAFFPFDPLLLKKARHIVQEAYVEWDNGEDDNEESD